MTEHPLMALLLQHNSFLGASEVVEAEITPLDDQLNFGPGDVAIQASANTPLERDFAILRGVDPTKHAETWPDWEERTTLNDHVLCEHFSQADPEVTIGWFHRLKVMPISKYRYRECRRWLKDGFPEEAPDWADKYVAKYTEQLAERAPDRVPRRVSCPYCDSTEVELRVTRRVEYTAHVGQVQVDGEMMIVPLSDLAENEHHTARLFCTSCHADAGLTDDEWHIPGITR